MFSNRGWTLYTTIVMLRYCWFLAITSVLWKDLYEIVEQGSISFWPQLFRKEPKIKHLTDKLQVSLPSSMGFKFFHSLFCVVCFICWI